MNCERCQHELEDFLYGELSAGLAGEMRTHLADCAGCAAARDELEREHELFARFYEQTAMDPTSEMWDAIRVRIAAEAPRQVTAEAKPRWWQSLASGWLTPAVLRQAALALLLIALSAAATVVLMKRGDGDKNVAQNNPSTTPTPQNSTPAPIPSPTTNVAPAEPPVEPASGSPPPARPTEAPRAPVKAQPLSDQELLARQLTRAEREYQSAIKMLDRAIAKRRDEIAPEALKQYQASLALIDSSIAQSKRALQERPDDPSASQFLLAAYAKKVELMQTIAMD